MSLGWVGNFVEKTICMSFDLSSLILDRLSQADLHSKSCSTLDSNFTINTYFEQVLNKTKHFDHGLPTLQNEVLIN